MRYFAGPGIYDSDQYFRGASQAIAELGDTAFMVSPGDIDPPANVLWTITSTLGTSYRWYPVMGNHELPGQGVPPDGSVEWMSLYDYGTVNPGPAACPTTTFSFDYQNAHFIVLNEYCSIAWPASVTAGDVGDYLYQWLAADLAATTQDHIFVIGHEPAFPLPDEDNGRLRHVGDSLDQFPAHRDRFWDLLAAYRVKAYICGHTHNYSAAVIQGVWQIDAGHARGLGDTGARSTFLVFSVQDQVVSFDTYRDDAQGGAYTLQDHGLLVGNPHYLPMIGR